MDKMKKKIERPERSGLETIHDSIDYDSKWSVFYDKLQSFILLSSFICMIVLFVIYVVIVMFVMI